MNGPAVRCGRPVRTAGPGATRTHPYHWAVPLPGVRVGVLQGD